MHVEAGPEPPGADDGYLVTEPRPVSPNKKSRLRTGNANTASEVSAHTLFWGLWLGCCDLVNGLLRLLAGWCRL